MLTPEVFDFPFTPYPIQHDFMKNLYEVIENNRLGIFESPTGTGKSLSIICGALKWLNDHNQREVDQLALRISKLEDQIKSLQSTGTDWLTTQFEELQITRKLNELKLERKRMQEYEVKINNIAKNIKKKNNCKYRSSNKIETDVGEDLKLENNDDDLVIEETNDADSSGEENEEDQKYKPTKILICSRTHSQLSQFIGEIIKSPFNKTRTSSLASRQVYCINAGVKSLKSIAMINERCLDMQRKGNKVTAVDALGKSVKKKKCSGSCPYYKQEKIEELRDIALTDICDIEELVKIARDVNACPYYSSRKAAEDSQLVLIPYNTLLHKTTREASGIDIKNNIVIIDEAHNLLEALAQMYGCEIRLEQLEQAKLGLNCYKKRFSTRFSSRNLLHINQLLFILGKLIQILSESNSTIEANTEKVFTVSDFVLSAEIDNYNMYKLIKFCKDSKVAHKINAYLKFFPEDIQETEKVKVKPRGAIQNFLSDIQNKSKKPDSDLEEKTTPTKQLITGHPFLAFISFMECLTNSYEDGRIIADKGADRKLRKLQFLLLNPAAQFKEIVKEARAVILAGGTMKPTTEFKERLFKSAGGDMNRILEFSCDHIIPPKNILPIILTHGPENQSLLFNYENRFNMGDCIKSILANVMEVVPGGIVVFFPSYKYESWFWQQLKGFDFKKPVFREPQDSSAVESVLNSYAAAVKRSGAVLFSVVGGKLSEGLNFSDDLGRCVIVIGLPYANIFSTELKEKMKYLDLAEGKGAGQQFYESLCMKSVNQCIGRAVRHRNDYACVLLVDLRYERSNTKVALPGWIQKSLITCRFADVSPRLTQFFGDRSLEYK